MNDNNTATPSAPVFKAMLCACASSVLVLMAYDFARTCAASLFITRFGSGNMLYAMTIAPFFIAAMVYAYGRLLSTLGGRKAMLASHLSCGAIFLALYAGVKAGSAAATVALYIFAEAYIVVLVEQYWSFFNSILSGLQAKTWNGPITGAAALGPIMGGYIVKHYAAAVGTEQFILLAGLFALPAALLFLQSFRLAGEPQPAQEEKGGAMGHLHLGLFRSNRTLVFIAAIICLSQAVAVAVNLKFYAMVENAIPLQDARTSYIGGMWFWVQTAGTAVQFLVTPAVLRIFSPAPVMIFVPLVNIAASCWLLTAPTLLSSTLALGLFKTFDYSIFRAAKETYYIPLSYDARFRAKQVIDSFLNRFSKGATAGGLALAQFAGLSSQALLLPLAALAASLCWMVAAMKLNRLSK